MAADPDKAENAGKKQSWFQTLPGLLTATAALLTAIGGTITVVVDYFSHPTGTTSQATATGPTPPTSMATISLLCADWQGWLDDPAARCRADDRAVAIGCTDQGTKLVVCSAGSGDLYFRAVTRDDRAIELPGAERKGDGFDVTTNVDGKMFLRQIRKDKLTILEDDSVISSEQFRGYASI